MEWSLIMNKIFMLIVLLLFILVTGCSTYGATGNTVNDGAGNGWNDPNSGSQQITGKMTGTGHERQCY